MNNNADSGNSTNKSTPDPSSTSSTPVTAERDNLHVTVIVCLVIALVAIMLTLVVTIIVGLMCRRCWYKRGQQISDIANILDPDGKYFPVCYCVCLCM